MLDFASYHIPPIFSRRLLEELLDDILSASAAEQNNAIDMSMLYRPIFS